MSIRSDELLDPAASAELNERLQAPGFALHNYPVSDIAVLKRDDGYVDLVARGVWDGTPIYKGRITRTAADLTMTEIDNSFAKTFPGPIGVIPDPGGGRGTTYILPEPEAVLELRAPYFHRGTVFNPRGPVYAERHPFGQWRLFISFEDWSIERPYAIASPDITLKSVLDINLARAFYSRLDDARLLLSGTDRAAIARLGERTQEDLALSAVMLDGQWRTRIENAVDAEASRISAAALENADAEGRPDLRLAISALDAARRLHRQALLGNSFGAVSIALGASEMVKGDLQRRFDASWHKGGIAGAGPALLANLRESTQPRQLLSILPALGFGPGWRHPVATADTSPVNAFVHLHRAQPDRAEAALAALMRVGAMVAPLRQRLNEVTRDSTPVPMRVPEALH